MMGKVHLAIFGHTGTALSQACNARQSSGGFGHSELTLKFVILEIDLS
jgi:hypothetical protein